MPKRSVPGVLSATLMVAALTACAASEEEEIVWPTAPLGWPYYDTYTVGIDQSDGTHALYIKDAPMRVFFGPGSATLSSDAQETLRGQLGVLYWDARSIHIRARTDDVEVPDDAAAKQLAIARAKAVRDFLVGWGVKPELFVALCVEDSQPIERLSIVERTPEIRRRHRTTLTVVEHRVIPAVPQGDPCGMPLEWFNPFR